MEHFVLKGVEFSELLENFDFKYLLFEYKDLWKKRLVCCFGHIWHNRTMCLYRLFSFYYSKRFVGVNLENFSSSIFVENMTLESVRNYIKFVDIFV